MKKKSSFQKKLVIALVQHICLKQKNQINFSVKQALSSQILFYNTTSQFASSFRVRSMGSKITSERPRSSGDFKEKVNSNVRNPQFDLNPT